jgi:hypothetical protein
MTVIQQFSIWAISAGLGAMNDLSQASAQHPAGYQPGMWLLTSLAGIGALCGAILLIRHRSGSAKGL